MNWISPRVWTDDTGTFGNIAGARPKAARTCRHTVVPGRRLVQTRSQGWLQNVPAETVLYLLLWLTCWAAIAISALQVL